ncbi:ORF6N domain-containing protein [Mediterraneibacter sp. NSJ-55]|uniref:ORF6N domain-containing protein n=1 Tax=Mediterraneibacter hominis TaxID=2763054 RepID=A0A923RQR0_9FIRM|nr:ORF6N domain-containing protein [Mediterraneibacter hominis]MBC5689776.1 ORF6N domain-containing protein [Mediterraneibacter hominis]
MFEELQVLEKENMRVLTTPQIAKLYGTTRKIISYNFQYNKKKYVEGKHYIKLEGEELREFKSRLDGQDSLKSAHTLYLWTEKGALLHAKSLNTDKAWEVYDYLVDYYFRAEEEKKVPVTVETKPVPIKKPEKDELPQIDNPIRILKVLLQVAEDKGIKVSSFPLNTLDSVLKNNHIGIRTGVTVEKACYELAWELSHAFIHYRDGDLVKSPLAKDYNEQATKAAEMIMKILNVKMSQM